MVASANASVATARYGPFKRSVGRPTSVATTAPQIPAKGSAADRSQCQVATATAPATAPTATNAICPSETWPAQPVRTTIERVTRQKQATVAAFC